jgi:allantoate deiminase
MGSRALAGDIDDAVLRRKDNAGISVEDAIRHFGCDPSRIGDSALDSNAFAYLEFHIEQGPVLESIGQPIAVVDSIVGQSRAIVRFYGRANHAGTTPMRLRQDALSGAAEWITAIEEQAKSISGLVATVGRIEVEPGAANVIPGEVSMTLDTRHSSDEIRLEALRQFFASAREIAERRGLFFEADPCFDQPAVSMNEDLVRLAESALSAVGAPPYRMPSGAGHDAMIIAKTLPSVMVFLRTPGGVSHHPNESVHVEDIEMALAAGIDLLHKLESHFAG